VENGMLRVDDQLAQTFLRRNDLRLDLSVQSGHRGT